MEVSSRSDPTFIEGRTESWPPTFLVGVEGGGRLRLLGELDVAGVPALRALLAELEGDIELDCSGLRFMDCSGLRLLLETQSDCENDGVRLTLIAPSRSVTRLLDLAGLGGVFDLREAPGS